MKSFLETILLLVVGSMLGNCSGDQLTIKDCATKGEAKMLGGGAITCNVIKEST